MSSFGLAYWPLQSKSSTALMSAAAFAERGLIEHLNGFGWLHDDGAQTTSVLDHKLNDNYALDGSRRVGDGGLDDAVGGVDGVRDVEYGEGERAGEEHGGFGQDAP